jgi:hypothetical protein
VLPSSFWFIVQNSQILGASDKRQLADLPTAMALEELLSERCFSRLALMTQQPPLSSECQGAVRYHPLPQVAAPALLRWSKSH